MGTQQFFKTLRSHSFSVQLQPVVVQPPVSLTFLLVLVESMLSVRVDAVGDCVQQCTLGHF
ncbi:hypothetical protein [Coleofasciculus sp. E1-EBD-02]|uniref:hypothetical protein n=1 Tax=Coleofasciculus sp. E1-EBD-02 TaxID=3068481 RepID=UPI0032F91581